MDSLICRRRFDFDGALVMEIQSNHLKIPRPFKAGDSPPMRIYKSPKGELAKNRKFVLETICDVGDETITFPEISLPYELDDSGESVFVFSAWLVDPLGHESYLLTMGYGLSVPATIEPPLKEFLN
jgi:hypothetical protein